MRGMAPPKQETDMNHELNINELDAVSGGLKRIPDADRFEQELAAQNNNPNTVGGNLTGNLAGGVAPWGCAAVGGHPI
jgi:bacteriocin-like protein